MVYYEVNFDYDNDFLCLANSHANFVIWKPQSIDLCWPVWPSGSFCAIYTTETTGFR